MFENIAALAKTVERLTSIDADCKKINQDFEELIPKVVDNFLAVQFTKDSLSKINDGLSKLRSSADSIVPTESPTPEVFEEIEDDESHIVIEKVESVIFPEQNDQEPNLQQEHEPLSEIGDWTELVAKKANELVEAGQEELAMKLQEAGNEVAEVMYDHDGTLIEDYLGDEEDYLDGFALQIWNAAKESKLSLKFKEWFSEKTPEEVDDLMDIVDEIEVATSEESDPFEKGIEEDAIDESEEFDLEAALAEPDEEEESDGGDLTEEELDNLLDGI